MNLAHVNKMKEFLTQIQEGKTFQFKSKVHPNDWLDCTSVFTLADCIRSDYELRVKPEPVFIEIAVFKGTYSKRLYSFPRSRVEENDFSDDDYVRVSDWVKVEIKDDVS